MQKMRVLLIAPRITVKGSYLTKLGEIGPKSEPLNLAYLGAVLKKKGHSVKILDCEALGFSKEDLIKYLKSEPFDIYGVTMLTPTYPQAIDSVKTIRQVKPVAKIVVGGPHPSIMPRETLENNPEINYAVVGEGEVTIIEFLEAVAGDRRLSEVKGIAYRDDQGNVVLNPARGFIKALDTIPIPDRSLFDMKLYRPSISYYQKLPAYVVLTSRGCPFKCSYCSKIFGNVYRHHSIERIIEEIKILMRDYGAREILFRDDTFTINSKFILNLCEEIMTSGLHKKIGWSCMTRVDLVDLYLLKQMKEAGCWGIHYGVESGSQRLLDIIKKGITIDQIIDCFKWTKEANIMIRAFFMLGLPGETREESLKTIEFAKKLDPYWAQFTITTPYPGTELYHIAKQYGQVKSVDWERYHTWAGFTEKELVFVTNGRTSDELKSSQKQALKSFYLRPKIILRHLFNLNSWTMLRKYFVGILALTPFRRR